MGLQKHPNTMFIYKAQSLICLSLCLATSHAAQEDGGQDPHAGLTSKDHHLMQLRILSREQADLPTDITRSGRDGICEDCRASVETGLIKCPNCGGSNINHNANQPDAGPRKPLRLADFDSNVTLNGTRDPWHKRRRSQTAGSLARARSR